MAGELQLGGTTLATHTGSGASARINLDSGLVFPAGHVIDFKSSIMSSEISGVTADTWVGTGLSINITPKYTNSKMVIWCSVGTSVGATVYHHALRVRRTGPATTDLHIHSAYTNVGYSVGLSSYTVTDLPNTDDTQCTYELYHYVDNQTTSHFFNYDSNFASNASMLLMEIKQ